MARAVMANTQLLQLPEQFMQVDFIVNDTMSFCVYPDHISIRQKDEVGKVRSAGVSKANWFQLLKFVEVINSCFLMPNEYRNSQTECTDNAETPRSSHRHNRHANGKKTTREDSLSREGM